MSTTTTSALEVTGLHKRFGPKPVLNGVDLAVANGTITAVLGPSGCGKTTLLRIVAGFETADAGSVAIDGRTVVSGAASVPAERRRVGVVPQEGALFPHLSVAANVGFGLPRSSESRRRVVEMLDLVGLAGFEQRRPSELSGGQQHRVALARALAPNQSLIMLDEPFSSLDTALRSQVRAEVISALRACGSTAVLVTHDQQEALSVADQVAVMFDGRIAQHADPATLYERPASLEVARFVGDAVVVPGQRRGDTVQCTLGNLATRNDGAEGEVMAVLRPEQLSLTEPAGGRSGTVIAREYFGHDAMVAIRLDDGTDIRVRLHAAFVPEHGAAVAVTATAASTFPR